MRWCFALWMLAYTVFFYPLYPVLVVDVTCYEVVHPGTLGARFFGVIPNSTYVKFNDFFESMEWSIHLTESTVENKCHNYWRGFSLQKYRPISLTRDFLDYWTNEDLMKWTDMTLHEALVWNAMAVFEFVTYWLMRYVILHLVSLWLALIFVWIYLRLRRDHKYKFKRFTNEEHPDVRADAIALGEMKHVEPTLAEFTYNNPFQGFTWLFNGLGWASRCSWRHDTILISLEMLAQLSVAENMELDADDTIVWERVKYKAKCMHSVNIDRYIALYEDSIVQNTCIVALALHRHQVQKRSVHPFPAPLPSAGASGPMGIAWGK
jgi:hypothetical protein